MDRQTHQLTIEVAESLPAGRTIGTNRQAVCCSLHPSSRRKSTADSLIGPSVLTAIASLLDAAASFTEEADENLFSAISDITHLIFSTSFYVDEPNPVTACDLDPTTLNSLISDTLPYCLVYCALWPVPAQTRKLGNTSWKIQVSEPSGM